MSLHNQQLQFKQALLYKNELIASDIKEKAQCSSLNLLQIYRNSFVMGVTEALAITYQHTLSLVGEAFFNSVARQFILQHPPQENNIITYGNGFSDYLETLAQLASMPYISEMARFEWLLEETSNLPLQTETIDIEQLSTIAEEQFINIQLQIPSQLKLFTSNQDIQHLYQMLVTDSVEETDLNKNCYIALIKQANFSVELLKLKNNEFALLKQIAQEKCLGELTADDFQPALASLMEKHLINGFTVKDAL